MTEVWAAIASIASVLALVLSFVALRRVETPEWKVSWWGGGSDGNAQFVIRNVGEGVARDVHVDLQRADGRSGEGVVNGEDLFPGDERAYWFAFEREVTMKLLSGSVDMGPGFVQPGMTFPAGTKVSAVVRWHQRPSSNKERTRTFVCTVG